MGYTGGSYETPWQTPNTGETAAPGRPLVETRTYLSLSSSGTERFFELRGALAPNLPEERPEGAEADAEYGTASVFVGSAKENLGARLGKRALRSWLFDGSLDFKAYRPDNSEEFPGALLYRQSVEFDERLGLELSEAAEKSQGAQGKSDSLLETSRLAAYKKKPLGLEPTWPFWMRADSRLFPISGELGRLREKRQSSLSLDAGQKSRLSPLSQSLQKENGLDFTHVSIPIRTSEPNKPDSSFGIFVATSEALSFFSGTEAPSTEPNSSNDFLEAALESTPFTFQDTHPSLIPMNLSGQASSEDWQTASLKTLSILDGSLIGRLEDSGIPRDSYGRVFTHRTYRGHDVYPLFNESSVIA
jgi:hypothetical protein